MQRSPHNGAAISTISHLLEAFKQPRNNQLMLKPPPSTLAITATAANATNSLTGSSGDGSNGGVKENGGVMCSNRAIVVDKSINTDTIGWNWSCINGGIVSEKGEARITIVDKSDNITCTRSNLNNNNVGNVGAAYVGTPDSEIDRQIVSQVPDDEMTRSNVSFDDLDLKCMCSEDEEDCANYSECGFSENVYSYGPNLIKQCSDMHLESRIKRQGSCNNSSNRNNNETKKKNYESCDNLYSCNNRNESKLLTKITPMENTIRNYYQLGYQPHHKHYRKPHECKLDSEIVTKKLLRVTKSDDTEFVLDEPPPVPPRQSLRNPIPTNLNLKSNTNNNILSASNLNEKNQAPQQSSTSSSSSVTTSRPMTRHDLEKKRKHRRQNSVKSSDCGSGDDSSSTTHLTPKNDDDDDDNKIEGAFSKSNNKSDSGKSSKRKKSPEKRLVLDLNDRSKYSGEVSV